MIKHGKLVNMNPNKIVGYEINQDEQKVTRLSKIIKSVDITPVVAIGNESEANLIDGHHRLLAAHLVSFNLPVILISVKEYHELKSGKYSDVDDLDMADDILRSYGYEHC